MSADSVSEILRVWLRREGYAIHAAGAAMPLEGDRESRALRELSEVVLDAGAVPEIVMDEEPTAKIPRATSEHLRALSQAEG